MTSLRTSITAFFAVGALVLSACATASRAAPDQQAEVERDLIKDGGTMIATMRVYPVQFNGLHIDATMLPDTLGATLPSLVRVDRDGVVVPNKDYLESLRLVSADPQVVAYRLNPKARWSDGTPITWADLASQWRATNLTNPEYKLIAARGYEHIAGVERGADEFEAIVRFTDRFAEWKHLFTELYPRALTAAPKVFNSAWTSAPLLSAGPFKVDHLDKVAKTITLVRDATWWGEHPKLDRIILRAVPPGAEPEALGNAEIDEALIESRDELGRVEGMPGVTVRPIGSMEGFALAVFNGAPGSIAADRELRAAVARGIDRAMITKAMLAGTAAVGRQADNHIFSVTSRHYRDHSGLLPFDPADATRRLDALGWRLDGDIRRKDGRPLRLRTVLSADHPERLDTAKMIQQQLGAIGVGIDLEQVPYPAFFPQYINVGNFDLALFARGGEDARPISSAAPYYTRGSTTQLNVGRNGNERIDRLFERASRELDDDKRMALGNEIDAAIWEEAFCLPLYTSTGHYAVRAGLVNTDVTQSFQPADYTRVGFLK
ncbi:ABC transporter family substrate-binding protein [Allokutzneria sp. A3M-2-11 16]|uniref:ABC transporter family substrate-binding protein n=1 Tax=Allokutzneria sp. A3M-2-11 16 TaxID=2962043 RepID=UPI0020B75C44|nr:ABC transporter family substrate-binding protein [Allokutzneria sp. A3M-2-11 16]MCP3805517.1 ABC transporter family substrate-binding protein [Allokutzneria sp. A3M-2-11 16]